MGEHGWVDMLTDVGRKLDRAESEGIARVAFYLRQNGQLQYAREVFMHPKIQQTKITVTKI